MTLWRLIIREIRHNTGMFILGLLAVVVGVGVFVGYVTLLKLYDLKTERALEGKRQQIADTMRVMQAQYREIMTEHGFNLVILPKDQPLGNFYDEGYASYVMPEAYAEQLARSNLVTIAHLLPMLEQKIRWPEQFNRTILLVGIRDEIAAAADGQGQETPILQAVAPGNVNIGYELWQSLDLQEGDVISLLGKQFTIARCLPQQGSQDDISVWLDLAQAQEMLGKSQQISMIKTLKTYTATYDFETIRSEITAILPDTQVVILENDVTTLAQARDRANVTEEKALAAEEQHRKTLRRQIQTFARWLIPTVLALSFGLIVLLAFSDVRKRQPEIGVLRTLGFKSQQIFQVFLAKALLIGFFGAGIGLLVGLGTTMVLSGTAWDAQALRELLDARLLLISMLGAPLLTLGAAWFPSSFAASQDPAVVLREA